MTIAFTTLGCKLNYAETSTYERGFLAHGLEVVAASAKADVYLVNTCSVTLHAESKCRGVIRRCHRLNPDAAIIVVGCYASLRPQECSALPGVRLVFGAKDKPKVVPEVMKMLSGAASSAPVRARDSVAVQYREASLSTLPAFSTGERTRSFLKVQDGCNNFCAYCTVPFARGESRNIPIGELVRQAGEIASSGVREIVLTGVNTGDFGRTTGESFLDLLKALDSVPGIERYRISSIEPNLLSDEIIDWIASGTKFQPHFHIPLQTGSDELLRKVGRRYDTALFASHIAYIRSRLEGPGRPLVFFGIDVIVGLPGETPELFEKTRSFLEQTVRPAHIHVFPYSRRPLTRAADMPGQVSEAEKTARVAELEKLSARLGEEFVAMNRGLPERVLWESSNRRGKMEGYTGNYIRLEAPWDPTLAGTLQDVII